MRLLLPCTLLLTLSTGAPVFAQNTLISSSSPAPAASPASTSTPAPAATATTTADTTDAAASIDYEALRADVARQNKALADKVNAQRALVRKNESILHDAQKMDAANKRLDAERKRLEQANAQLEKERQSLAQAQKAAATEEASSTAPAAAQ